MHPTPHGAADGLVDEYESETWTTEFSTIRGTPHAQFAPHVTGMLTSMLVDHFAFAPGWPFDGSGNSIAQTSLSDFSDQV
jgi:hypothetical protein